MPSTYTPISSQTVSTAAATITFSSIPSTYTDLILTCNAPSTSGAITTDTVKINGDTGTNYSFTRFTGDGSSSSSDRVANTSSINSGLSYGGSFHETWVFYNYANTNMLKTIINKSAVAQSLYRAGVSLWRSTAAINSIAITDNNGTYAVGSTFTLYGITAA